MQEADSILIEIRDMLKLLMEEQEKLAKDMYELKEEQRKLKEEVKLSNFVLHNIGIRNEIMN